METWLPAGRFPYFHISPQNSPMRFGIIGSGSWATALAKILTDNNASINWWVRSDAVARHIQQRHHNPHYLTSVYFDASKLYLSNDLQKVISNSDCIVIAVPSAYIELTFRDSSPGIFVGKKIVSAVKGILPDQNLLLNDFLKNQFAFPLNDYFTVMGPCHAEEVAA